MKKVAIVYSGSKTGGGVDTYLTNLFENVDRDKIELVLFSLGQWAETERLHRLKHPVRILSGKRFRATTAFEIARELRQEGYQLVVSQGVVANAYARIASMLSGIPNLVTIHSDIYYDYDNLVIRKLYMFSDLILRWRTRRYIAVSRYLADLAIKKGVVAKKIKVVPNGVVVPKKLPTKKDNKRVMIGSAGRLHPVKNYKALISAMRKLSTDGFDLTIWGEGAEGEKLHQLIGQHYLGLSGNVFLPGRIPDIWEVLSGVDIYIQPSLSEGFGLAVVEAQLAGIPVIVTPGGALTERVIDGKTGLVTKGFEAENIVESVLRYYEDPDLMKACAEGGRAQAQKDYNIKIWAEDTIRAYLEAAK